MGQNTMLDIAEVIKWGEVMPDKIEKPEILSDEDILKAFDSDFGEVYFDHKPTPEELFLIKLKLVAHVQRDDTFKKTLKQVCIYLNDAEDNARSGGKLGALESAIQSLLSEE